MTAAEREGTIRTVAVPVCPLCGDPGALADADVRDIWHRSPGRWTSRRCDPCHVLWLDPRPASDADPLVYPEDYVTHGPPTEQLVAGIVAPARLRLELKREILRLGYGYASHSDQALARLLGRLASSIAAVRRRSGYTVRFLPARGGRLLDVGCGNGSFLWLMQRLGWDVAGIEPDPVAAGFAQRSGFAVSVGAIDSVPLNPDGYHAVTMNHVIEHMGDPVEAMRRISDALLPGGLLVSISPNPDGLARRLFGPLWRSLDPPRHVVLFGPPALAALARRFGLVPEVWTTNRNTAWVARDSLAERFRSQPARVAALARCVAGAARLQNVLTGGAGEEVVLIARKP